MSNINFISIFLWIFYSIANLFLFKDFSWTFKAAIMKISWTLFFINRLSSTSENYFPDLRINLSRPGTYRPLVTEGPPKLEIPDHPIRSEVRSYARE